MNDNKHYYAFISHSSKDEKFAIWLRDKLVNYNIPASVQREQRAPKRLRPVFIYQTDLAGANLQDALQQELNDSQWLIVICSPDGARSQYVNAEVEQFIATDRANRIIPFIVAGTPHAKDPHDECFPPALLKLAEDGTELRGVNLAECQKQLGSKMGAVVNVVATMLGVRFDSMWNVYRRKQRRLITIAAVCALFLCLAGLFTWDYLRPTYKYYADYVDKWGVPEGVVELTKERQSHRYRTYLFEYRRIPFGEPNAWQWRVVKVSYVNSADVPQVDYELEIGGEVDGFLYGKERALVLEIKYNKQNGLPTQWIYCDEKGKAQMRHVLSERNGQQASIVDFVSADETHGVSFKNHASSIYADIVRYAYERDANGFVIKQTFHANNDYNLARSAIADNSGVYGYAYHLDSLGRRVKVSFLGKEGEWVSDRDMIAGQTIEYDTYGNICRMTYIDRNDQPALYWLDYATVEQPSDVNGNCTKILYFDTEGNFADIMGYSKKVLQYDEHGFLTKIAHFNKNDKPVEAKWFGHKIAYKYDSKGRKTEIANYDINGHLKHSKTTYQYDKDGNCIERATYDTLGQLCNGEYGYAISRSKYDKDGNCIEWQSFNELNQPSGEYGIVKATFKYDAYGRDIEMAYWDINNQLCFDSTSNFAKLCWKYDSRGNCIEYSYYGTDGNLRNRPLHAFHRIEYDDNGRDTEWAYYGADEKPCVGDGGYFRATYRYDDHGKKIEEIRYDTEGNVIEKKNQ